MYNLSTDYERLWEHIMKGDSPIYDDSEIKISKCLNGVEFETYTKIHYDVDFERFLELCKFNNLRWIDPQPVAGKWVPVFDPSAGGTGIVEVFQPAEEKKPFTMQDFEKGLMLAGHIEPANKTEEAEKALLGAYEAGQQSIIEQLKGLETSIPIGCSMSKRVVRHSDIESIINQSK